VRASALNRARRAGYAAGRKAWPMAPRCPYVDARRHAWWHGATRASRDGWRAWAKPFVDAFAEMGRAAAAFARGIASGIAGEG
jgi:hypothetical protein